MELKQRFAILNEKKKIIKSICPEINNECGIYLFYRKNDKGENCVYIGQAKKLLERTASHLLGYKKKNPSHVDKSLYKHKIYSKDNPFGWRLKILCYCNVDKLDLLEKQWIEFYTKTFCKVYNVTGGGQFDKAEDVGERYEVKLKTYRNGKNIAYNKAKEYVKTMFDKYLDYTIKGKTNKIKERKLKEFKEFLGGTENDTN